MLDNLRNRLLDKPHKIKTVFLGITHILASLVIIFFVTEIIELWDDNNERSIELIGLIGLILEVLGFVVMLHPKFIRLANDQMADITREGIIYVLVGLMIQTTAVYFL